MDFQNTSWETIKWCFVIRSQKVCNGAAVTSNCIIFECNNVIISKDPLTLNGITFCIIWIYALNYKIIKGIKVSIDMEWNAIVTYRGLWSWIIIYNIRTQRICWDCIQCESWSLIKLNKIKNQRSHFMIIGDPDLYIEYCLVILTKHSLFHLNWSNLGTHNFWHQYEKKENSISKLNGCQFRIIYKIHELWHYTETNVFWLELKRRCFRSEYNEKFKHNKDYFNDIPLGIREENVWGKFYGNKIMGYWCWVWFHACFHSMISFNWSLYNSSKQIENYLANMSLFNKPFLIYWEQMILFCNWK